MSGQSMIPTALSMLSSSFVLCQKLQTSRCEIDLKAVEPAIGHTVVLCRTINVEVISNEILDCVFFQ